MSQDSLDLASAMDAARAISGEIVLSRLLARTMTILLESTGAQRGVFLTRDGERYRIEVECFVQDAETKVLEPGAEEAGPAAVPLSIVNYTLRTRSPLVLNDALNDV